MNISELFLLSSICLIAMVSPGPDFLLVTKNALLYPRRQALCTAFGIVVGCLFHATYCVLGLALVITKSVLLFSILKYAGACYLVYLGIKGLTSKPRKGDESLEITSGETLSSRQAFLQGFLCNVLNPKLAVFLLSLFTQFITTEATFFEKGIVASVFFVQAAIYWPLLVLGLQTKMLKNAFVQSQVLLDRICGGLLVYLGVRVALRNE